MRSRVIRGAALTLASGAAFLFLGSACALADGGQTIAGATPVVLGQLEFGNTANGSVTTDGADGYESYWALEVTNGDDVTIAWQAPLDVNGNGPLLSAYEVGTNDAAVEDANPDESDTLGANGQDVMTFTADETGIMPLQFESNECCDESVPGPYQFTATITHAVALTVPTVSSLSAKGTLNVSVENPDGARISDPALTVALQVEASGQSWSTIGTASPTGGTANIAYTVPSSLEGKTVQLQALAQGAAYQTQTSGSQSVTVAASGSRGGSGPGTGSRKGSGRVARTGAACVVPSLMGKKLSSARHALKGSRCRLGRLRHARASRKGRGRVIWQSAVPGSHVRHGTKVNLVVGR
ncbi:MAG TPA: PASTA domain-containing protein [Solirubrobacteraceae bacterium]